MATLAAADARSNPVPPVIVPEWYGDAAEAPPVIQRTKIAESVM
ncbi:MAG: hypothetical protein R3344_02515 [Acidobacteriota bacterium]|nr:hypothetical protein [Acidobacteriota bacterium]